MAWTIIALSMLFTLASCSSDDDGGSTPAPFDITKYDRSCAADTDCVAVFSGDPCGCSCEMAAVSTGARAQVNADRTAYQQANCAGTLKCEPCAAAPAVSCNAGQCATVP